MIEVGQGPEISDADEAGIAAELGIGRWCCQRENVYEMKPAELMCSNLCRETFQLLLRTELVSFQPHTAKLLCSAFRAHSEIEVFQWLSTYQTLGTYYLGMVLYCESEVE